MKIKDYLLLLAITTCSACQSQAPHESELVILKRSTQCSVTEPVLRELHTPAEIRRVFGRSTPVQIEEPLPEVDLTTQTIMLLAMGLRPSAGYTIDLESTYQHRDPNIISLNASFRLPKSEMAATVMTSPCLIFSIRNDGWREITAGETRLVYRR